MSRQDPKNFSTFYSNKRSNEFRPPTSNSPAMVQGRKPKNFVQGKKKQPTKPAIYTNQFHEIALQQKDQRFRYLLKNGDLMRIQKGGNIIFAQLPQIPNIWVCYRRPIQRQTNPDKLNLDSLQLNHMPLLQGQQKLKMLTYQHNNISRIQNLISLPNIIYIDLYDNSIKQIQNLQSAKNIKVLLLAKNNINRIKNLSDMPRLQVLDLHSNKLSKIQGLSNLSSLKILNLSYNSIFKIQNLDHITQLTELNLKSNKINLIEHIRHLTFLEKLFLSNNKIEIKNIETCQLTKLSNLKELTLQDNPCYNKQQYLNLHKYLHSLKMLDGKPSKKQKQKEREKQKQNSNANSPLKEQEQYDNSDVLKLIVKQWQEQKQRVLELQKQNSLKKDLLKNSCITGGHAEIEDQTVLFIFGNSYEAVLSDSRYYDTVQKIKFEYIVFQFIIQSSVLSMLRKFKKLKAIEFKRNYITSLLQIAKLQALPALRVINIDKQDNPIYNCSFLKQFIVYRFPTVAVINRLDVKQGDRTRAKNLFHNFDRMLQIPQKFFNPQNLKQYPSEDADAKKDKNYLKMYNKYVNDTAESEIRSVCEKVLKGEKIRKQFQEKYDETILHLISQIIQQ